MMMNPSSRSGSFTITNPISPRQRRPSVSSRLSFAVSTAERGDLQDEPGVAAEQQIEEEIAEIKRYEVRHRHALACALRLLAPSQNTRRILTNSALRTRTSLL